MIEAETAFVPPAIGLTVSATRFPVGLLTLRVVFNVDVVKSVLPIIWEVPVARPTKVRASSTPLTTNTSCPASAILTCQVIEYVPMAGNTN